TPRPIPAWLERRSGLLVASALAAAGAGFALPGPTGETAAVSAVLALGAIALLARHSWAIVIIAAADVALLGLLAVEVRDGVDRVSLALAFAGAAFALPGVLA